jgi:radical SAM superfamily enzyme YgiQ (UPF0313 family)
MRLLLVWPSSLNEVLGWGDLGAIAEPLALEYLAAGAAEDGHEYRILDLRLHVDALDEVLTEFRPDVIGVTGFSMHVRAARRVMARSKELLPGCVTVVGGHHATLLPDDYFHTYVDYVVVGEGVETLRAILARIAKGGGGPLPGAWARRANDCFEFGGDAARSSLEDLPLPDRRITSGDRQSYYIDWMRPVALVRTTVGCPFRCTFCSLWQIADGKYLMRDIARVVDEMRTVEEPFVFLVDDEAFVNGRRMERLAAALAEAGIKKRYFAYCRIDTIIRNRRAVAAWCEIGLERLFVGIDGIGARELELYNKKVQVAQIDEGLEVARELGVEIFAQFVVDTDATERDFERLRRFIEHKRIRYPSFTVLTPLPGTDMLRTFDRVTELDADGRPNWDLFDCQNAVVPTRLPRDRFMREYRNLYHVFKGTYSQYRAHPRLVDELGMPQTTAAQR